MRKILIAMMMAGGVALVGPTAASAAAVNGPAISDAAAVVDGVTKAQHWRWGSGGHYRWGSRGGHYRWGSAPRRRMCHRPYSSRWRPCW